MAHLVHREPFQGERGLPVIDGLYVIAVVLLATYGLNALVSVTLYLIHRNESRGCPDLVETPPVTVQLPIYNEMFVLERLLSAVVALEYPRDRLHIQVLYSSSKDPWELTSFGMPCRMPFLSYTHRTEPERKWFLLTGKLDLGLSPPQKPSLGF